MNESSHGTCSCWILSYSAISWCLWLNLIWPITVYINGQAWIELFGEEANRLVYCIPRSSSAWMKTNSGPTQLPSAYSLKHQFKPGWSRRVSLSAQMLLDRSWIRNFVSPLNKSVKSATTVPTKTPVISIEAEKTQELLFCCRGWTLLDVRPLGLGRRRSPSPNQTLWDSHIFCLIEDYLMICSFDVYIKLVGSWNVNLIVIV